MIAKPILVSVLREVGLMVAGGLVRLEEEGEEELANEMVGRDIVTTLTLPIQPTHLHTPLHTHLHYLKRFPHTSIV